MPQLHPTPWFNILVFSWLIFIVLLPPKILNHTFPNEPALHDSKKSEMNPWNWPWP